MNKLLSLDIAFHVSTLNLKSVSYRMFPKKLQSPETNRMIPNKTFREKSCKEKHPPPSYTKKINISSSTVLRRNLTDTLIVSQYSRKHTKPKIMLVYS